MDREQSTRKITEADSQSGDVILASASPRRIELLSLVFEQFQVIPSRFDEDEVPDGLAPPDHVRHAALMKARDVVQQHPDSLVIGSDTIVVIDEQILGKPADTADALRMLRMLSGRTHQVYSGIAVIKDGIERTAVECTDVRFSTVSDEVISRYVATREPMDKAGAYAIQGKGSVLIEGINGCYFNVVGLPIFRLGQLLRELGIQPLSSH